MVKITNNLIICLVLALFGRFAYSGVERCPNDRGLSSENEKDVTDIHNELRHLLVKGLVPSQPKAKYMKHLKYDKVLAKKCEPVSNQCFMNHIEATDPRWSWVGQNIYIECKSRFVYEQNWTGAVNSWFEEHLDFQYPNRRLTGSPTGHYTQVAWADSDTVGCDFISFINSNKPDKPFCKMYTCNYGPGGNFNNLPPYEVCK